MNPAAEKIRFRPWEKTGELLCWALVFLVLAGIFPKRLHAETHYFPQKNYSLQDIINMAASGDTIIIFPGTYSFFYKNLIITQEFLTLRSTAGAADTILQGRGKGPVVTFTQGSKAVLDGFTITRVRTGTAGRLNGGGIYCAPESAPAILNNVITGNEAVFGGGIYCDSLSAPIIDQNRIFDNSATVSGGGVFSFRSASIISNNRFVGNTAANSGGAIGSNRGTSRMNNNVFWKNQAGFGGGISCDRSAAIIVNNTLVENVANYGGGIVVDKGSVRLTNLILWHNKVDDLYLKQVGPAAQPEKSLIGDGNFRGINGNISTNPFFVDAEAGNFRLLPKSPCIDTGNIAAFYEDTDGSVNDMGAYGGPDSAPLKN